MNSMKSVLFLASLFTMNSLFSQTTIDKTMISGGISRSYKLYIPASYNSSTAVPLVLNLHGRGSTSAQQLFYGDFRSIADTANFIMVLPQGTVHSSWGATFWNAYFGQPVNDINFLSELIDTISQNYNIDQDRIHATGMSNGGYMSLALAAGLDNKIASVASVTGTMTVIFPSSPVNTKPISVLQIHGTADSTVKYNGDISSQSVNSVLNYWKTHNNTTTTPIIDSVPNINLSDNSTAIKYTYGGGNSNTEVIHYKVVGGEHTWPGAAVNIGVTNKDFNASDVIWKFFNKHPRTNSVGVKEVKSVSNFKFIYDMETNSVKLSGLQQEKKYSYYVYNNAGARILYGFVNSNTIQLPNLKSGMYIFNVVESQSGAMESRRFISK